MGWGLWLIVNVTIMMVLRVAIEVDPCWAWTTLYLASGLCVGHAIHAILSDVRDALK